MFNRRKHSKFIAVLLSMTLIIAAFAMPSVGFAAEDAPKTINVNIIGSEGMHTDALHFSGAVSSDEAVKAGFVKPDAFKNQVTVLDALVAMHRSMYGTAFDKNPKNYLDASELGWLTKIFGVTTSVSGFLVNGSAPVDPATGYGSSANSSALEDGNLLAVFIYSDKTAWSDVYLEFAERNVQAKVGEKVTLTLNGMKPMSYPTPDKMGPKAGYNVRLVSAESRLVYYDAVTDENGKAVFNIDKAGTYIATVVGGAEYFTKPYAEITVEADSQNTQPLPQVDSNTDNGAGGGNQSEPDSNKNDSPQTGDEAQTALLLVVMGAAVTGLYFAKRRMGR